MLEEIFAHFYKHKIIMKRRPAELMWVIVHPFIALLSLGILGLFVILNGAPQSSMMFIFVGVVMWNFYDISQRAITFGITLDVWNHCLKHTFSTKAATKHFILGNSIFGFYTSVIAFVLVGIIGFFLFGFNIFSSGLYLLNLFPVFFFATALGLVIDALIASKGEKYISLIWMVTGIVMIFSGVYYPVQLLPSPISEIVYALPTTHAIDSIRFALQGSAQALPEMVLAFLISIPYMIVCFLIFRKGLEAGYKNGTITNY